MVTGFVPADRFCNLQQEISPSMNKFDRITAILIHLQSKRLITAQELSERFEVSQRTIYRDIESLSTAGVPIIGEIGVG